MQPLHCQVGKNGPGQGDHALAKHGPGQHLGGVLIRLDQVPQLQPGLASHVQQAILQQRNAHGALHREQKADDFQHIGADIPPGFPAAKPGCVSLCHKAPPLWMFRFR